jgi:hypothetical protein
MDPSSESLIHAGDYKIEQLFITSPSTGETADITDFMMEINLYEDLFSFCMTGNVIVADAANLISNLPIVGNEFITVKFRTPTLEDSPENVIQKTFQVYAIYDRILNDDRSQFYNISFISPEGYEDQTTVIGKSYNDSTDAVVKKIYEEYIEVDRPLIIFDTPHTSKIKYTSNYWSPFKNMNFVASRVKGSTLAGSDYLFFETNKSFYFASIESLIDAQVKGGVFEEYVLERDGAKMPRRINPSLTYLGKQFPPSMTSVENLKLLTSIDTLDGNNRGAFASTVDGYDFYTKKIVRSDFDFIENMSEFKKTGPTNILPPNLKRNALSNKKYYSQNTGLYNDFGLTDEEDLPAGCTAQTTVDRIGNRKSYLNSFENYKFEATLPGRTDINVGHVISLLYPSAEAPTSGSTSTILDPLLSGLYIISAIHHKFNADRHVMTVEMIKNGLSNSPESVDMSGEN